MEAKLGVLIIHGVGSHKPNFANPMIRKLKGRISGHAKIRWQTIYWFGPPANRESKLLKKLFREGKHPHWLLGWFIRFKLRKLVMDGIGDVAAYRSVPDVSDHTRKTNEIYDEIHDRVHKSIVELRRSLGNEDKPVIVVAHSLGSVIMYDYIWDRQHNINEELYGTNPFEGMKTLVGFITFGSPIPLFAFGYGHDVSIEFPLRDLPSKLKEKAKWLNFYDADDVFGWPLEDLENCVAEDRPISVGSIFTRWNIACHSRYWTDNNFTEPVARYISEILEVCH